MFVFPCGTCSPLGGRWVLRNEPRADTSDMRHDSQIVAGADDPPPVVMMERRCTPDRRTRWRGGRRDRDWLNRPLDAWSHWTLRNRLGLVWRLRRGAY